jgi:isopenicillin N synthase-like dioxygenase
MENEYVPIISLAGYESLSLVAKSEISRRIDIALKNSGFFICVDHSVRDQVTTAAAKVANQFFDLPLGEKMKSESYVTGSPRGYIPYGLETLSLTDGRMAPPDVKEGYGIGPNWVDNLTVDEKCNPLTPDTYTQNLWPAGNPEFKQIILQYYSEMEILTDKLMELFAISMGLEPSFLIEKFTRHNSTLRLLHYPPQDVAPEPGQLRAGAHTDFGALTILRAEDKQGGLQVRKPSGQWEDIKPPPGAFIINIGDLMMNWSNDKWLSNYHRVVNPPASAGASARRLSIAYFCNPRDDLLIACIPTCCSESSPAKYAPIEAGQHRLKKIMLSQKRKTDLI